jgi:hypothetical protein
MKKRARVSRNIVTTTPLLHVRGGATAIEYGLAVVATPTAVEYGVVAPTPPAR